MRLAYPILALTLACAVPSSAQLGRRTDPGPEVSNKPAPHRTRLILRDGSYQIVMSYTVVGKNVQYVSAERGGDVELIPLDLVDLDATKKWEAKHPVVDLDAAAASPRPAPVLDPELAKEEAENAALSPEVAPDLRLQPEDAILALDNFRAVPELVPLTQTDGELNKQTGHSILRGLINPQSSPHQLVVIKGEKAPVQFHVDQPAFYIKLDDALPEGGGAALTIDTHGASRQAGNKPSDTDYVILRVDVRQDARVLASFNMQQLGTGKRQQDVFETDRTILPGGHWMKIVPHESLLVGEYALVEVLDDKSLNLGVWDFGIHPTAPENRDVLKPEPRRPVKLEKRERP